MTRACARGTGVGLAAMLAVLASLPRPVSAEPTGRDVHRARATRWEGAALTAPAQLALFGERSGRITLLDLAPPCAALAEARVIALTAERGRIERHVDEVVVRGRRCGIQRMRLLDPANAAELVPDPRLRVAERPRLRRDGADPRSRPPD